MVGKADLEKIRDCVYEIPSSARHDMRVPARIYLDEDSIKTIEDGAIEQVANVACLEGIQRRSIGLPDIHFGYGFSIGGVAAFAETNGVISPGGVGFDINCGVRLLKTNLTKEDIQPHMKDLVNELFNKIPSGLGSNGIKHLKESEIDDVLQLGAKWAIENGYGWEEDLKFLEENGCMKNADPEKVSTKAKRRGIPQLGSLGSGNHFLEIQTIDDIYDEETAKAYGVEKDQVVVLIHTGSRGCGYQICADNLRDMDKTAKRLKLNLPDRQLACAPIDSDEGQNYLKAMAAGANYAWTNRQMIQHWVRESFENVFKQDAESLGLNVLYDVAHNIIKKEKHTVGKINKTVYVHRKGATRAFGPGRKEIPEEYRSVGQPVLLPGTMGTSSYLLAGTETAMKETFGSTAHGAGRVLSRSGAKREFSPEEISKQLADKGIILKANSQPVIAEEAPGAYKDIDSVVKTADKTGISKLVARMKPLGVIKG
ncbi:RtcB family protein [uncultured Methanosphaera sp.]|uniref:RtcB family protein n=1 Tax=uncultured Methanosphaera sp. TaxID=262501 RepID=UPI000DC439E7|nr:RtcB family protein [uncultured Methanosphaera sp.]MDD6286454.1 RtcB family protein [Methanobacteriaceae archaeon]MDY2744143.1 RtcB family protein [Methanosphaera sp.]RAP45008.1 MAG: RNA-splicing ligase RtcB [Methanosphaera sp. SHI1033]